MDKHLNFYCWMLYYFIVVFFSCFSFLRNYIEIALAVLLVFRFYFSVSVSHCLHLFFVHTVSEHSIRVCVTVCIWTWCGVLYPYKFNPLALSLCVIVVVALALCSQYFIELHFRRIRVIFDAVILIVSFRCLLIFFFLSQFVFKALDLSIQSVWKCELKQLI